MDVVQVRSISIPEVPDNFHTEILYSEVEAHFDLTVPVNAHNILAPPQLISLNWASGSKPT